MINRVFLVCQPTVQLCTSCGSVPGWITLFGLHFAAAAHHSAFSDHHARSRFRRTAPNIRCAIFPLRLEHTRFCKGLRSFRRPPNACSREVKVLGARHACDLICPFAARNGSLSCGRKTRQGMSSTIGATLRLSRAWGVYSTREAGIALCRNINPGCCCVLHAAIKIYLSTRKCSPTYTRALAIRTRSERKVVSQRTTASNTEHVSCLRALVSSNKLDAWTFRPHETARKNSPTRTKKNSSRRKRNSHAHFRQLFLESTKSTAKT